MASPSAIFRMRKTSGFPSSTRVWKTSVSSSRGWKMSSGVNTERPYFRRWVGSKTHRTLSRMTMPSNTKKIQVYSWQFLIPIQLQKRTLLMHPPPMSERRTQLQCCGSGRIRNHLQDPGAELLISYPDPTSSKLKTKIA